MYLMLVFVSHLTELQIEHLIQIWQHQITNWSLIQTSTKPFQKLFKIANLVTHMGGAHDGPPPVAPDLGEGLAWHRI